MTTMTFEVVGLRLGSLELHPANVRGQDVGAYGSEAVARLAANIREVGLLQPLLVQETGKGRYGVLAGGRRLSALKLLAGDRTAKGFTAKMSVPCRVVPADTPATTALSLSENEMQAPMDAIDRYEAFVALRDRDGLDIAGIARVFGLGERAVRETLRIGLVHEDIRAAHRAGDVSLETLRCFAGHPDPAVQCEVFVALSADGGRVSAWRVRQALDERGVRRGDALGAFVVDEYLAAGGAVAADLIEEDSVLSDPGLVQTVLAKKLDDMAEEERARLGFAWAEHRVDPAWNAFERYGRVYPELVEVDAETQAKVDGLNQRLDELAEAHEAAADEADEDRLAAEHDAVSREIDALTMAYPERHLARAGVIAVWERGGVNLLAGLVRPEDKAPKASGAGAGQAHGTDAAGAVRPGPKMSARLSGDLARERARAVGLALARDPVAARLYADWLLVSQMLTGLPYCRNRSSLRFYAATFTPEGVKAGDDPEAVEAAHGMVERQLAEHEAGLPLYWTEFGFAGFATLDADARDRLVAWAVSRTLEPSLADDPGDAARDATEAAVLPDLRAVWRPDARLFGRLTKPDLLRLLRDDLGLGQKADTLASEKKSVIVEKVAALFADPPVTISTDARAALDAWCPPGMQTVLPETVEADAPAGDAVGDAEPVAA